MRWPRNYYHFSLGEDIPESLSTLISKRGKSSLISSDGEGELSPSSMFSSFSSMESWCMKAWPLSRCLQITLIFSNLPGSRYQQPFHALCAGINHSPKKFLTTFKRLNLWPGGWIHSRKSPPFLSQPDMVWSLSVQEKKLTMKPLPFISLDSSAWSPPFPRGLSIATRSQVLSLLFPSLTPYRSSGFFSNAASPRFRESLGKPLSINPLATLGHDNKLLRIWGRVKCGERDRI